MKNRYLFVFVTLISISTLYLPNTFAQNPTRWSLPEGAIARFGKGPATGTITFSPDGTQFAIGWKRVFGYMMQKPIKRLHCSQWMKRLRLEHSSLVPMGQCLSVWEEGRPAYGMSPQDNTSKLSIGHHRISPLVQMVRPLPLDIACGMYPQEGS